MKTSENFIDGSFERKARKDWACEWKNQARRSPECKQTIQAGTRYIEYLGLTAGYQSGEKYCMECAKIALKSEA